MSDFVSGLVRTSANRKSGGSKPKAPKKTAPASSAPVTDVTPEQLKIVKDYLVRQGLFDTDYYVSTYADIAKSDVDPKKINEILEKHSK